MPTTKPLQHGNTLYCVTDQREVLPVTITFISDEATGTYRAKTLLTELAPDMQSDADVVSCHEDNFAKIFSFDGVVSDSNVFDERQDAYDYAIMLTRKKAASLAAKMLANDKHLERLNKESKA